MEIDDECRRRTLALAQFMHCLETQSMRLGDRLSPPLKLPGSASDRPLASFKDTPDLHSMLGGELASWQGIQVVEAVLPEFVQIVVLVEAMPPPHTLQCCAGRGKVEQEPVTFGRLAFQNSRRPGVAIRARLPPQTPRALAGMPKQRSNPCLVSRTSQTSHQISCTSFTWPQMGKTRIILFNPYCTLNVFLYSTFICIIQSTIGL